MLSGEIAPGYTLRPATEHDRAWLRWLHHATLRESVERVWGWEEAVQDALFDKNLRLANRDVIQVDGHDVGVIRITRRKTEYFLDDIEIDPAYQGRGVGTSVIRALQDQARAEGLPVGLQVIIGNRAKDLYERHGFEVRGQTDTHFQMRWAFEPPSGE